MNFYPYAPIKIPKQNNGLISRDREDLKTFWAKIEKLDEGLSMAIGLYIFSIRGEYRGRIKLLNLIVS